MKRVDAAKAAQRHARESRQRLCKSCNTRVPQSYLVSDAATDARMCFDCYTNQLPENWELERRAVLNDECPFPILNARDLNRDDITDETIADEIAFWALTGQIAVEATPKGRMIHRIGAALSAERRKRCSTLRDEIFDLRSKIEESGCSELSRLCNEVKGTVAVVAT